MGREGGRDRATPRRVRDINGSWAGTQNLMAAGWFLSIPVWALSLLSNKHIHRFCSVARVHVRVLLKLSSPKGLQSEDVCINTVLSCRALPADQLWDRTRALPR